MQQDINGMTISYENEQEFTALYSEIFEKQEYHFTCKHANPLILDCGAHIGLSVLYFKQRYPGARIIAFEPDPRNFRLLEQNVTQNHLQDVQLVHAALAGKPGQVPFYVATEDADNYETWGWASSAIPNDRRGTQQTINVDAVTLSSFIQDRVDFLKLDIEGLECEVLTEAQDRLGLVQTIVMEFHGDKGNPKNDLRTTLDILKRAGLTVLAKRGEKPIFSFGSLDKQEKYLLKIHASQDRRALWRDAVLSPAAERVTYLARRIPQKIWK